ncbi:MAG: uracil-xanthine permease family protein [Blautia hansenii]|nr:solute carrier family 23 protein [Blautia hansenii]MBS5091934.1 NCS2 family nucleobase:cation symporter [Lachnospiraceae bacterium]MEE0657003.1 solute carrier family 23 protein [Blautia hansenii]
MEGRIPLGQAILYGLQHVMAMFVGNLTPVLLITGACALDGGLQLQIIQNAMLMAGLITLLQIFTIGPVGAKLPIVMGTSSGFIGVCSGVASTMGQGIVTYGAIIFASFIGGLFETVLGFFLKPLRRFFPSLVTGTVVMAIGLSLISVGINSFGGGNNNGDFGSLPNLFVGTVVLVTIILLKHFTKGVTSTASILIGIVVGYIVCGIMGMILPTTYQYIDPNTQETVTKTCSWVLDFSKVGDASWFAVPAFMPFGFSKDMIDLRAIIPIVIMFIVTAVETVGDTSAITEGGLAREATDKELSGSVICDGLGSSIAAFFGVLPNTSFSQNVGLIAMTKIVNLFAISTGAIFLVLCGLFPKLAAIIQMMPQSVLGGAAVMMFASIVVSGIQLVTKDGVSNRTVTIVSVALGLGYGLGANTEVLSNLPQFVELIFGGSGIVPAAIIAMILNIAIPKDKEAA